MLKTIKTGLEQQQLAVLNLQRQVDFFVETLGFTLIEQTSDQALIGFGLRSEVVLKKADRVCPAIIEITLRSRRDLAKVIGRLCTLKYKNTPGQTSSRQFTELIDPEGNSVKIGILRSSAGLSSAQELDIESLFNELQPDDRLCDKMPDDSQVKIISTM